MRKIKYLIFGLLLGCLGLTSFSSSYEVDCLSYSHFNLSSPSYIVPKNVRCQDNKTSCMFGIHDDATHSIAPLYQFKVLSGSASLISNSFSSDTIFPSGSFAFYNQYQLDSCSVEVLPLPDVSSYESTISTLSGSLASCQSDLSIVSEAVSSCQSNLSSCQSDLSSCVNAPSGGSCSNTGTVSDLTNSILLYTGEVALNTSYHNIFNYGDNGAGTYCIKLSSSNPQTLTFGFANGGTTTPTNLYTLYNDQYSEVVCLYGNKPYFNAKLNSSSNTVSYQIYKLSDLYSSDVCLESSSSCPSCPTCEDCSSIQEALSGCLEDYDSVSNMNQSLTDELEACLESGGGGCNPETDTGCVEGTVLPLLSWSVGLDSFSTPIINNLTLPTNYKGKLVDGVLSISSVNQNLSINDSDYGDIKDSFVSIVLYIFGVGLMLILVYYIKFYFFNIKD